LYISCHIGKTDVTISNDDVLRDKTPCQSFKQPKGDPGPDAPESIPEPVLGAGRPDTTLEGGIIGE
jgi:hypothetical protein